MTTAEIRAMLRRVNARELRESSGISVLTVTRALRISRQDLFRWESLGRVPETECGRRWIRFVGGLERHARVTAELAATERGQAA